MVSSALAWVILACEGHRYVTYELRLVSATRQMVLPGGARSEPDLLWSGRAAHKDEHTVFAWTCGPTHLGLELSNKSAETLRLHWDRARFVDEAGQNHPLRTLDHGGPTAVVEPGARWVGGLYPADYEYEPGRIQPLLPSVPGRRRDLYHVGEPQELLKLAGQTVGKSIAVELPVSVGEAEALYRLEFDIRSFDLHREGGGT